MFSRVVPGVSKYIKSSHFGQDGQYLNCTGGQATLYASCFAAMSMQYIGELESLNEDQKMVWADYICGFQDQETGLFMGPEIQKEDLRSAAHSLYHVSEHLTAHALPAIYLLGAKPKYPLKFAEQYMDPDYLQDWLSKRNWSEAWLEGNNLLFVGQFLTDSMESGNYPAAKPAFDALIKWLDNEIDPDTGLWGTNGFCDVRRAIYGAYHQLLLYFYHDLPLTSPERLVDCVLSIQHRDGGFAEYWGGGSCEDADAVDLLVNLHRRYDYRRNDIEHALRKAALAILRRQTKEGGFVYKRCTPFIHNGLAKTAAPADVANAFSTWFAIMNLGQISTIIQLPGFGVSQPAFNNSCSMGWHNYTEVSTGKMWAGNKGDLLMGHVLGKAYFQLEAVRSQSPFLNKMASKLAQVVKR